jgi:hypothetical protein
MTVSNRGWKIPKEYQNPQTEGHTTQWPKEKDKQRSIKHHTEKLQTYHWVCKKGTTTGVIIGQELLPFCRSTWLHRRLQWGSRCSICSFSVWCFIDRCLSFSFGHCVVCPSVFLSLYIFTIWKCIVYYRLCRDGIYFDKILLSEYKLFN